MMAAGMRSLPMTVASLAAGEELLEIPIQQAMGSRRASMTKLFA
jgi:hypothetical protein